MKPETNNSMSNKFSQMCYLAQWFVRARFFGRRAPMQSVLFITDRCNLSCKHCSVYNHTNPTSKSYEQIREELKYCHSLGSRFVDTRPARATSRYARS